MRAGGAALLLLLAACAPVAAPPPPGPPLPAPAEDSCGATPLAGLIGQPATALERVLIMRPIRILRPGEAMTADYSAARINFDIDAAERIARIWCG